MPRFESEETQRAHRGVDRPLRAMLVIAAVVLVLFVVFRNGMFRGGSGGGGGGGSGGAPVPAMFDAALTLEDGLARAASEGRITFAFATADWCGPCQIFKRGALSDPRVEAWVAEHAVPVYIDIDDHQDLAQRLRIDSIPVTILLRENNEIARTTGVRDPDDLLAWLNRAAAE